MHLRQGHMTSSTKQSVACIVSVVFFVFCVTLHGYCTLPIKFVSTDTKVVLNTSVLPSVSTVQSSVPLTSDRCSERVHEYIEEQERLERERIERERLELERAQAKNKPTSSSTSSASSNNFRSAGVLYDGTYKYTWYSSNSLYHYRTPEWTPGPDGIYRDSDGYVVVASSDYAQGTVISNTPFGACKVYDSGCASGTIDVYTNF